MKLKIQILLCLPILEIAALTVFAPLSAEMLAMLGLAAACVVVTINQGTGRAIILFLKEMW